MNKILFSACCLIICCSVKNFAMQTFRPALYRTYSTNPGFDKFKHDILVHNYEDVSALVRYWLPTSLDAQYALLGLKTSNEIRVLLIDHMLYYWYDLISKSPEEGLATLFHGLTSLTTCYGHNLRDDVLKMLINLKKALLLCNKITGNKRVMTLVNHIPDRAFITCDKHRPPYISPALPLAYRTG